MPRTYIGTATNLLGTLGVTVLDATGAVITARSTAAVSQPVGGSYEYQCADHARNASETIGYRWDEGNAPSTITEWVAPQLVHVPAGWIMWGNTSAGMSITTDDHGNILVGVLITAYLQSDVNHTTPINSTNSGVGGVWSLPLPAGLYDLVFQLPGQTSVTVKVTVA